MKFWILPYYAVVVDKVLDKITENFVYIYFRTPNEDYYKKIDLSEKCKGSVEIWCHDISPEKVYDKTKEWKLFSIEDAENIVKCVLKNIDNIQLIVCQCDGGISRSSAVACALDECIHSIEKSKVWIDSRFVPNRLIYETIKKVYYAVVVDKVLDNE